MKCPACGAELASSGKFCEMCGSPLPGAGQDVAQPAAAAATPSQDAGPFGGQPTPASQPPDYQQARFQPSVPPDGQPSPSGQAPGGASPPQSPYPPYPQSQVQAQAQVPQASNTPFVLAIIALVASILGLFPVSIVLAIVALVMNSGQKKRGETSTRQTPTFVMALVSLILSILMALVTALVGGVLWLAVVSGDLDLDDIGETAAQEQASSSSAASSASSASGKSEKSDSKSSSASEKSDSKADSKSSSASEKSDSKSESKSASSKSESKSTSKPKSYNTYEMPTLADFQWFTADMIEGKLPKDATVLTDLGDVSGGWKAYQFGTGLERFFNIDIGGSQADATLTYRWGIVYDGSAGTSIADDSPDMTFSGAWENGYVDAVGPGRVTLTDFWQEGDHQYAVGSFMWPSGEVDDLVLVRP